MRCAHHAHNRRHYSSVNIRILMRTFANLSLVRRVSCKLYSENMKQADLREQVQESAESSILLSLMQVSLQLTSNVELRLLKWFRNANCKLTYNSKKRMLDSADSCWLLVCEGSSYGSLKTNNRNVSYTFQHVNIKICKTISCM